MGGQARVPFFLCLSMPMRSRAPQSKSLSIKVFLVMGAVCIVPFTHSPCLRLLSDSCFCRALIARALQYELSKVVVTMATHMKHGKTRCTFSLFLGLPSLNCVALDVPMIKLRCNLPTFVSSSLMKKLCMPSIFSKLRGFLRFT